MRHCIKFVFLLGVYSLVACRQHPPPLFVKLPSSKTGIDFQNLVYPNDTLDLIKFRYFYNGGGVGVGDINNDGLPDVYFTGNMVSSRLYMNQGQLQFTDITKNAQVSTQRWATGVSMADVNQDGWLDIYVSVSGSNQSDQRENLLFINQGADEKGVPKFKEMAEAYGLDDAGYTTHSAFFDYDQDGDLDVYLLTAANSDFYGNTIRSPTNNGDGLTTDRLYQNQGVGLEGYPVFQDVSLDAGILAEGFGLGVSITDLNRDGWSDIYVSNDYLSSDLLYINNQDGTFQEQASQYFSHQSYFAMGNDVADINNDALPDVVTLDMLPPFREHRMMMVGPMNYDRFQLALERGYAPQYMRNTLQLNRGVSPSGQVVFSEVGQLAGIHQTGWSWSPLIADFDNDGFKDIYITNGYVKDITNFDFVAYQMPEAMQIFNPGKRAEKITQLYRDLPELKRSNFIFHNEGNLQFSDQSSHWGITHPSFSHGAAYADLDQDGDLDLLVNNTNDEAFVYENQSSNLVPGNHFLRIELTPSLPGTKIYVEQKGQVQHHESYTYRGYQSTVEEIAHFGLGEDSVVDKITILWPNGSTQVLQQIEANQTITVNYAPDSSFQELNNTLAPLWRETSQLRNVAYQHKENLFVDFNIQPLLPHKNSQVGPGLAAGDVNGDGLEDFFVGGAFGQPGAFFYQQANGHFHKQEFIDSVYEDTGVLLFDADQDQDLDMYVVSGGGAYSPNNVLYQDRLYTNQGNDDRGYARFVAQPLPKITSSGSCVTAADYDRDGDLDIFVGGKVLPHQYPLPSNSYLLKNEESHWLETTPPDLQSVGIVNTALWTDFNNDGWVDLVVAGEWMPLTFFKNEEGTLSRCNECVFTQTVDNHLTEVSTSGWWNSLVPGDFDRDGDLDYIAGNLGQNSYYQTSQQKPFTIYAKDFDENGSLEAIISAYEQNTNLDFAVYPIHGRDEMTRQIVALRRRFPQYADYAKATLDEVLTPSERRGAYEASCHMMTSSYIENMGSDTDGSVRFHVTPLPIEAQFAPVYGLLSEDINRDGNLDVLLVGNSYAPQVQTGRYDALTGLYLQGDGQGNFSPASLSESGFYVSGDSKALIKVSMQSGELLVASRNNDSLLVFEQSKPWLKAPNAYTEIQLQSLEYKAEITWQDGKKEVRELPYGSGYLSQSSRTMTLILDKVQSVIIRNYNGSFRKIDVQKLEALSGNY